MSSYQPVSGSELYGEENGAISTTAKVGGKEWQSQRMDTALRPLERGWSA